MTRADLTETFMAISGKNKAEARAVIDRLLHVLGVHQRDEELPTDFWQRIAGLSPGPSPLKEP